MIDLNAETGLLVLRRGQGGDIPFHYNGGRPADRDMTDAKAIVDGLRAAWETTHPLGLCPVCARETLQGPGNPATAGVCKACGANLGAVNREIVWAAQQRTAAARVPR